MRQKLPRYNRYSECKSDPPHQGCQRRLQKAKLKKKTLIALIFVCTVHFSLVEDHQIRRTLGRNCCLHTCSMPEATLTLFFSSSGSIDPYFTRRSTKTNGRTRRSKASKQYIHNAVHRSQKREKKQKAPWYKIFSTHRSTVPSPKDQRISQPQPQNQSHHHSLVLYPKAE